MACSARDRVLIATKIGRGTAAIAGLSRDAIMTGVEESLRRLRTHYIDVYLPHLGDRDVPLDEKLEAFDRLVKAGKVRARGASQYEADWMAGARTLSASRGIAPCEVFQPRSNLLGTTFSKARLRIIASPTRLRRFPYMGWRAGSRRANTARPLIWRDVRARRKSRAIWMREAFEPWPHKRGRRRFGRYTCARSAGLTDGPARCRRSDRKRDQCGAGGIAGRDGGTAV